MSNEKIIGISISALMILIALSIAVKIFFRPTSVANSLGERLLAHHRDRSDYRILIGMPTSKPTAWAEVSQIDNSTATLQNSLQVDLSSITAYLVAYPNGELVEQISSSELSVPSWVRFLEESERSESHAINAADLKDGIALVRVEFGKSTVAQTSQDHYSTSLTNLSNERVRVRKFGGYQKSGKTFILNTVTKNFFTAEQFKEWYNQKGEWIEPGESVTDPNNYGGPPALWAYFCESESGAKFTTGGIVE